MYKDLAPSATGNKSMATENSIVQKKNKQKNYFSLVDNRSSNAPLIQLKTRIINQSQTYDYGIGKALVGKKMESWLDPTDMKKGQSADVNTSQKPMMDEIRRVWKIVGGDVVKGHLLNDNLGGSALNNNLYPITRAANKDHLMYVENAVKQATWGGAWRGVYYKVEVEGKPQYTENEATFKTEMKQWNPVTNTYGRVATRDIPSDLKKVSAFHSAYDPNSSKALETIPNPNKPSDHVEPSKKVSDLTGDEILVRDAQPVKSEIDGNIATHWNEKGKSKSYII